MTGRVISLAKPVPDLRRAAVFANAMIGVSSQAVTLTQDDCRDEL